MFTLYYKKQSSNDKQILNFLADSTIELEKAQYYSPVYKKFFSLNETNYNSITLNHKYNLKQVHNSEEHNLCEFNEDGDMTILNGTNSFSCDITDISGNIKTVDTFFKFSPLLDPVKYALGKYIKEARDESKEYSDDKLFLLPNFKGENEDSVSYEKINDSNNSAFVDGMFTYLTSQLLHTHKFPHALDYYGSFIGLKNNFVSNVADELELLFESDYFEKNLGKLFHIDSIDKEKITFSDTRNFKSRLKILGDNEKLEVLTIDNSMFEGVFEEISVDTEKSTSTNDVVIETLKEDNIVKNIENDKVALKKSRTSSCSSDSSTSCSSRSSDTENDYNNDDDDDDEDSEAASQSGSESEKSSDSDIDSDSDSDSDSEDSIKLIINKFPCQMICLEKCEDTLDSIMQKDPEFEEWRSIFMQIIMTLICYQKSFKMTHNDLHTNNIMYVPTEKQYLYYRYNEKYYKVPTYGKLYKIIDFGRAIYSYNGVQFCSDSFHDKGDAATQYNFEPYYNPDKPRVEPNYSFDLCRLACSMFDFFIEDMEEFKNTKLVEDPIAHVINEWCLDDKGRNVLYKSNNEERYPDFKLYKMIARKVHNHTPQKQIEKPMFDAYRIPKKKLSKKATLIDIDTIPVYA